MTIVGFADKVLTGSGNKPFRLAWWFLGAWLLNFGVFWYCTDKMAPTSVPLLQNADLRKNCADRPDVGWTKCYADGMKEYPKFYAPLYALDVLVPIMDLQQSRLWQPISGDGGWGTFAFFWRCLAGAFGWLLGVALGSLALRYVSEPKEWGQAWGLTKSN
ncbi:MAG: hypothetical protein ACKVP3_09565 [Hyphomicrobiaceae bacterium]